ncbi:hypothetical protein [Pseudoalteromonas fuliginea]|uniref:hypothetical protein n=1 Tax=Pseudoalteromonas fuliginea TaxID=1872678 RepID=UPI00316EB418
MADILWDLVAIRDYVGIFITWFFVIAFLYNLSASINSPYKNTMYLSGIMMISYTLSTLFDMVIVSHLNYFYFDIATLIIIFTFRYYSRSPIPNAFYYLVFGLSINASLFLAMHYDIEILGTLYYWWFWNVYVFGMYFTDLIMPLALIFNKDFLGLVKFTKFLAEKFNRSRHA